MTLRKPPYEVGIQDGMRGIDNSKAYIGDDIEAYQRGLADAPWVSQQTAKPKLATVRQRA